MLTAAVRENLTDFFRFGKGFPNPTKNSPPGTFIPGGLLSYTIS